MFEISDKQQRHGHSPPAKPTQTRDARGQTVTMIDPVMLHLKRQYDVMDADTLDAINDDLEPGSGKRLRSAFLKSGRGYLEMVACTSN